MWIALTVELSYWLIGFATVLLTEVFELFEFSSEFLAFVLEFSVTGLLIWFLFLFCGVWKKSKIYGLKIKEKTITLHTSLQSHPH